MRAPPESRRPGSLLQVIRPDDPEMAIAIAEIALAKQDGALLGRLPQEVGGYTFVGYAAAIKRGGEVFIVDLQMKVLGKLQRGDSIVTGVELPIGSTFSPGALGVN
jgi:hypothetical protein